MALPVVNSSRYSTTLPSTGEELEYRPYLVKEEKIMMVALESKDNKQIVRAMKNVISSCVYNDVDVNSFTSFDLEWMFLQLRTKSVGGIAQLNMSCEADECGAKTEVDVNLEEVELSRPNESKVVDITDDVGLEMKYPSVETMEDYDEEKLKSMEGAFELVAQSMVTIFDKDNVFPVKDETPEDVRNFLESLSSLQFGKIIDWMQNTPSVSKLVEWNCIQCGHKNSMELRGLQNFFT